MRIIKIHGSTNWLYCDNCRRVYWFSPTGARRLAAQLLHPDEWCGIYGHDRPEQCWTCRSCPGVPLSTRLATFSYVKALDFPMFQRSWLSAERLLRDARKWVFIGCSLPAADYEFKYLLKRVQLARNSKGP